ncbi:flippase-like domain-containing protein [candidate division WWE3 bacterium]|nr:flippase-like domain-containing protein [candidate division WWE3 bacterium]
MKDVHLGVVWESLSKFNKLGVLGALCIWMCGYMIRAFRWQIFLNAIDHVSWRKSFNVLVIGFMSNALLPLRAGEFIRAYLLNQVNEKIPTSTAFATIAGERVFDGLIVVALTIWGASSLPVPDWASATIQFSTILFIFCFFCFLIVAHYARQSIQIIKSFSRYFPKRLNPLIYTLSDKFIGGLVTLTSWKNLLLLLVLSIITWSFELIFMLLCAYSFHFSVSLHQIALLTGLLNLGVMIPAAPGGVGTIEFINVAVLTLFSIQNSEALAYGVVTHAATTIGILGLGIFALSRMHTSIAQIWQRVRNQ